LGDSKRRVRLVSIVYLTLPIVNEAELNTPVQPPSNFIAIPINSKDLTIQVSAAGYVMNMPYLLAVVLLLSLQGTNTVVELPMTVQPGGLTASYTTQDSSEFPFVGNYDAMLKVYNEYAVANVVVGGTITPTDTLGIDINGHNVPYTVTDEDTSLPVLAGHMATALNEDGTTGLIVTASTNGSEIILTAILPGSDGEYSLSVSSSGTETLTKSGSGLTRPVLLYSPNSPGAVQVYQVAG
jgi:hypothetical protein